jgi:hypothetical protein
MMEATRTSETLVSFYQTTRRYNPEDSHLWSLPFCGRTSYTHWKGVWFGARDVHSCQENILVPPWNRTQVVVPVVSHLPTIPAGFIHALYSVLYFQSVHRTVLCGREGKRMNCNRRRHYSGSEHVVRKQVLQTAMQNRGQNTTWLDVTLPTARKKAALCYVL